MKFTAIATDKTGEETLCVIDVSSAIESQNGLEKDSLSFKTSSGLGLGDLDVSSRQSLVAVRNLLSSKNKVLSPLKVGLDFKLIAPRQRGVNFVVDGLSGGAAIAVTLLAELLGVELRDDLVLTGHILGHGEASMVGNLGGKLEVLAFPDYNLVAVPYDESLVHNDDVPFEDIVFDVLDRQPDEKGVVMCRDLIEYFIYSLRKDQWDLFFSRCYRDNKELLAKMAESYLRDKNTQFKGIYGRCENSIVLFSIKHDMYEMKSQLEYAKQFDSDFS